MMIARRLVRSHKKDVSDREGNKASNTLGIVSPTMTQKAIMPPNALSSQHLPELPYFWVYIQYPLRQRNCHQPRLPETVLDSRLERIGAAEFRIDDYELDRPINGYGEADEEESACDEASIVEGVRLADDSCSSANCQLRPNHEAFYDAPARFPLLTLYCSPYS